MSAFLRQQAAVRRFSRSEAATVSFDYVYLTNCKLAVFQVFISATTLYFFCKTIDMLAVQACP